MLTPEIIDTLRGALEDRDHAFNDADEDFDDYTDEDRAEFERTQREAHAWLDSMDPRNACGPYSPELAEAFRQGARELCNSSLGDKIEVPDGAHVKECHGDGVMVACWLYVHDNEREKLAGEE